MMLNDLPKKRRKAVEKIVASMDIVNRQAWDEMIKEDESLLLECLITQFREHGTVFDLDGIKKHFRLARIMLGQT